MKLKQFSKKSVSIILAVLMIMSALLVGTFTTTAVDGAVPADDNPVIETHQASSDDISSIKGESAIDDTTVVNAEDVTDENMASPQSDDEYGIMPMSTSTTVYFAPENTNNKWQQNDKTTTNIKYVANYNRQGDAENWNSTQMTDTGQTVNGKKVYKATFTDLYDGLGALQFQKQSSSGTWLDQVVAFSSWTAATVYNNKFWNGSNWVTYSPDATTSYNWGVIGNINGRDNSAGWDGGYSGSVKMSGSSSSSEYTASITTTSDHKYFRIIRSDGAQFGSTSTAATNNNYSLTNGNNTSSNNAYTTGNNEAGSLEIDEVGTFTVHISVSNNGNTVKVWYTGGSASTHYYIGGRFKIRTSQGSSFKYTGDTSGDGTWNPKATNMEFTRDSSSANTYTLNTYCTLNELSAQIGNVDPYFFIHTGSGNEATWYGGSGSFVFNSTSKSKTLTAYASSVATDTDKLLKFSGSSTQYVVLHYNSSTRALSYTLEGGSDTYSVTMDDGIKSDSHDVISTSGLEGTTKDGDFTINIDKSDLTVELDTKIREKCKVPNEDYYYYKLYGYSILMTLSDGSKKVDSLTSEEISNPNTGEYYATYKFPSNISSAHITPVFSASDEYAEAQGMYFTTVYLNYTPGDNEFFNGTYEPCYYSWRTNDTGTTSSTDKTVKVKNYFGTEVELERQPVGAFPGQKMLYLGNGTYMAEIQSYLTGILFNSGEQDGGDEQTFDFAELIHLQRLGYNHITFEPRTAVASEAISEDINKEYGSDGNKVYTKGEAQIPSTHTNPQQISTEFDLYTDLQGHYIDVFGNHLLTKDGNIISQSAIKSQLSSSDKSSTYAELNKLREVMGISSNDINALYGARYGLSDKTGNYYTSPTTYGMTYPIRVYYFNNSLDMVAQMISGYGTIEYNYLPGSTTTNADRYTGTSGTANAREDRIVGLNWDYYTGTSAQFKEGASGYATHSFTEDYNIISKDYVNIPYLVSYKTPDTGDNNTRIDGRWYYSREANEFNIDVKVGTLNGKTVEIDEDNKVGTATVGGQASVTAQQGTKVRLSATPKNGYKFVGWYTTDGKPISEDISYLLDVTEDTTAVAVFEPSTGTLTIRHDIFTDKADTTIGNANLTLTVKHTHNGVTKTLSDNGTGQVTFDVETGDSYQVTISATSLRLDTFLRFLSAPNEIYGESDYTVLDDPDMLKENPVGTWTYTFDDVTWDNETTFIQFYSDIAKASYKATLTYKYKDRFGKSKTYVVKNVPLSEDEIKGYEGNNNTPYAPSNETILNYAPEIDGVFKDCVWNCNSAGALTEGTSFAELVATQTYKEYVTYVDSSSGKELHISQFNDNVYLVTDKTIEDGTKKFVYWEEYALDRDTNGPVEGTGNIFSYSQRVGITVTFDRYFKAVYVPVDQEVEKQDFLTNVQEPIYTREKYTDPQTNTVKDYVYSDFLIQFDSTFIQEDGTKLSFAEVVNQANSSSDGFNGIKDVKFGVIAEFDYNAKLYDGTGDIVAPEYDEDILKETIKNLQNSAAEDGDVTSGWSSTEDDNLSQYNYYYSLYNLNNIINDLTDFGRYDFYFKFDNSNSLYQGRVYNVYTYIMYTDANGETQVIIGNPQVLNIYAEGHKEAEKGE